MKIIVYNSFTEINIAQQEVEFATEGALSWNNTGRNENQIIHVDDLMFSCMVIIR